MNDDDDDNDDLNFNPHLTQFKCRVLRFFCLPLDFLCAIVYNCTLFLVVVVIATIVFATDAKMDILKNYCATFKSMHRKNKHSRAASTLLIKLYRE